MNCASCCIFNILSCCLTRIVSDKVSPFKVPIGWNNHDVESPSKFRGEHSCRLPPFAVMSHKWTEATNEWNIETPITFHQKPVFWFCNNDINGKCCHRNKESNSNMNQTFGINTCIITGFEISTCKMRRMLQNVFKFGFKILILSFFCVILEKIVGIVDTCLHI